MDGSRLSVRKIPLCPFCASAQSGLTGRKSHEAVKVAHTLRSLNYASRSIAQSRPRLSRPRRPHSQPLRAPMSPFACMSSKIAAAALAALVPLPTNSAPPAVTWPEANP